MAAIEPTVAAGSSAIVRSANLDLTFIPDWVPAWAVGLGQEGVGRGDPGDAVGGECSADFYARRVASQQARSIGGG